MGSEMCIRDRVGVVPEPRLDDVDVRLAVSSVQAALGDLQLLRERADSVTLTVLTQQPPR